MAKMKSHSGARKRFKKTKTGLVKFSRAYRRHLLEKKSSKRKRQLRKSTYICDSDMSLIIPLLPYS